MRTDSLRVLHAYKVYELFSKGGGVERYIHQVCLQLLANGHRPRVVAGVVDANPDGRYPVRAASYAALWREVGMADVVHIHGARMVYSSVAGLFAILRGKRLVYTAHCFYEGKTRQQALLKYLWDHTVERFLLAVARPTILLSDYWKAYVKRRWLPTRHVAVLPNGIDVDALASEPFTPTTLAGSPAILSVCRLDPVKRVEDIIAVLSAPGLELAHAHIVGRGDALPQLEAAVAARGLAARATFHHFKNDAEVAAMARAAQVFVIASAEEGMPTAILEMLARGVPVVASEIPGNLSLMRATENDHTYPLGDIAALGRQILRATQTRIPPATLTQLKAQFDWGGITRRMLHYYQGG